MFQNHFLRTSSEKVKPSLNFNNYSVHFLLTGYKKAETMPTNACQYFYECESPKTVLKPNKGDCCVYCSFGSIVCPPIQENKNCC